MTLGAGLVRPYISTVFPSPRIQNSLNENNYYHIVAAAWAAHMSNFQLSSPT